MPNAVLSNKVIHTVPSLVQKIEVDLDTEGALAQAMEIPGTEPDEYWFICATNTGTTCATVNLTFDTTNGEVDIDVDFEGGSGDITGFVFLKWYDQADQDGSSFSITNSDYSS